MSHGFSTGEVCRAAAGLSVAAARRVGLAALRPVGQTDRRQPIITGDCRFQRSNDGFGRYTPRPQSSGRPRRPRAFTSAAWHASPANHAQFARRRTADARRAR